MPKLGSPDSRAKKKRIMTAAFNTQLGFFHISYNFCGEGKGRKKKFNLVLRAVILRLADN